MTKKSVDQSRPEDKMAGMSDVTLSNLLPVPEAASRLGIDQSLVHRYIKQGRLRAVQLSRLWMIDAQSLEEFQKQPRRVGNPNFSKNRS